MNDLTRSESTPRAETIERMRDAAKLRAEAASWDDVALRLGFAHGQSACQNLACAYPDLWKQMYADAYEATGQSAEAEAVKTCRELLSVLGDDPRVRVMAASALLRFRARYVPQTVNVNARVVGKIVHENIIEERIHALAARIQAALPGPAKEESHVGDNGHN